MDKHCHITPGVKGLALELAAVMPYRRSAEVLRKTSAIDLPHQTIWRLLQKVADPYLEKRKQELKWFKETGEMPGGEGRGVARLMIEADGVILSLQREKEKRAEVKLGIAYEGWEQVGKNRHRTVNKTAFAAVAGEQDFWAGMSLKLQEKYDLSCIGETIVGGDGAWWVKEGASYMGGRFQLDNYHLNRELTTAFSQDRQTKGKVWQACQGGKVDTALQIMAEAISQAHGDHAKRLMRAYNYLKDNSQGLGDYRLALGDAGKKLRRTGAIEGNVDKMVVRRMKNQGMNWTKKGIVRLLCVRLLVLEDKLTDWLANTNPVEQQISIPKKRLRRLVNRLSMHEPDDWLKTALPALAGPYPSRPWVQALKSLSRVPAL